MDLTEVQERIQELAKQRFSNRTVAVGRVGSAVGSPGQAMQKRLREMFALVLPEYDFSRLLVMDVGDITVTGPETGYNVGVSLPVASDIWYLTIGASVLPFRGDEYQVNAEKILGFLANYLTRLDNIKPLKNLQSYENLHAYFSGYEMRTVFDADHAPHVIRETRFETWMLNRSTEFPSKGPKASIEDGVKSKPETSLGQLYCGLLSFPVGPLGVMEVLSIFSESMDDMLKNEIPFTPDGTVVIDNPNGWKCVTETALDGLMSPMTDMKGDCPGVHLVNKGYLIESRDAEYPAEPFAGYDKILPLHSMRYYLRRDAKWPLPGEFIGLLAKPWPSHVWWFQETSPLLYAGNWFETNYYTSGVIKEILQSPEGAFDLVYRCVVRGVEVCVASSDFYGHKVGDRVAILRINDLDRFTDATKGNFKWKEMEDLIVREKMEKETPSNLPYIVNPNMMILPMSFYKP
jgi:hypothetical protein